MSAFDDFIQAELPRRPWSFTDGAQETIPVRRGAAARQLSWVSLADGQVLGMVNGQLQGVAVPGLGGTGVVPKNFVYTNTQEATTWTINHNQNSVDVVAQVYDVNGAALVADSVSAIDANTVVISFAAGQSGKAILLFAS